MSNGRGKLDMFYCTGSFPISKFLKRFFILSALVKNMRICDLPVNLKKLADLRIAD
jgi:hypothetical protein